MTEAQARLLISEWQGTLKLDHWRLEVKFVEQAHTEDGNAVIATCDPSDDYDQAKIEITRSTLKEKDCEETIVHELLHVVFREVEGVQALYRPAVLNVVADTIDVALLHAVEGTVDRLAYVLVALKKASA